MDSILPNSQAEAKESHFIDSHADLQAKLEALFPAEFKEISLASYSSRGKRSLTLLANKDPQHSIQSRSEWLSFDLNEILFVARIELIVQSFESYDNFELSFTDSFSGEVRNYYISPENGQLSA